MSPHVRVLLVDGQPLARIGIRSELARHADIEIVGEAADGDEALHLAEHLQPDVLILSGINIAGLGAVELVHRLSQMPRPPRMLVLEADRDPARVLAILKAGATGYLFKDEEPSLIAAAVRAVAQGKTWLSSAVAESIVEHTVIEGARAAEPELSVRETEVLHLLAQGMSNKEIGERLCISERTVRYHLRNIYDKLGLRGRGEAIAWAVRKGLGEETAG